MSVSDQALCSAVLYLGMLGLYLCLLCDVSVDGNLRARLVKSYFLEALVWTFQCATRVSSNRRPISPTSPHRHCVDNHPLPSHCSTTSRQPKAPRTLSVQLKPPLITTPLTECCDPSKRAHSHIAYTSTHGMLTSTPPIPSAVQRPCVTEADTPPPPSGSLVLHNLTCDPENKSPLIGTRVP